MTSVATVRPDVRAAFRAALLQVEGIPGSFHWQGERFTPVVGTPFLRESVRPLGSPVRGLGIGGTIEHRFALGATLFYPSGQGTLAIETAAGRLVEAFYPGRSLVFGITAARITAAEQGDIPPLEADWIQAPVTLTASAFTGA